MRHPNRSLNFCGKGGILSPLRCESDLKVDGEPCVFESAAPVT